MFITDDNCIRIAHCLLHSRSAGGNRNDATPWLGHSSEDEFLGMRDDGPLLIEDDEPSPRHNNNTSTAGGNSGGHPGGSGHNSPGGEKPVLMRASSGAGSPRKTRNKTAFGSLSTGSGGVHLSSHSTEDMPPEKSPTGILKNPSGLMNNWLGKTIFGSFRVGFEDATTLDEVGENERDALLQNVGGSESVALEVNTVENNSGGGGSLPRPHNTGMTCCCWFLMGYVGSLFKFRAIAVLFSFVSLNSQYNAR